MNNWKWAQERYKNDPEYLAILREENRRKCKEKYAKKKEQKENGSTGNSADSDSVSSRGGMSRNYDNSDKELSEGSLGAENSSSQGGLQTTGL